MIKRRGKKGTWKKWLIKILQTYQNFTIIITIKNIVLGQSEIKIKILLKLPWSKMLPGAWHINMNPHALNRDGSSYIPQEYLHLVGK